MEIAIKILEANSPMLQRVIELGDANNATLGFLPPAAFTQAARQGHILVAITSDNQCVGYLLYRVVKTKQIVSITHLCVDANLRGNGLARKLVEKLKELSKEWRGISLSSRRDYTTNTFWEHMGFVAVGEKPGRGKDRMQLTRYWYDNQHPSLITLVNNQIFEAKSTQAVIDANIVYKLYQDKNHPLLADWLLEDVVLCISPELFNEINRSDNKIGRNLMRNYARNNFPEISYSRKKFGISYELIKSICTLDISRPQHDSDLKQVSYAIAGNAEFFVTEDNQLISNLSEYALSEFGLRIVRPDDLIVHLDELMNSVKYQQHRLAGSLIKIRQVSSGESDHLARTFQVQDSEKKAHLARNIRQFLAQPQSFESNVVTTQDNDLLALIVYSKDDPLSVEIPIIRVVDKMNLPALASHLLFRTVRDSVKKGQAIVRITDGHLGQDVLQGIHENSFSRLGDFWIKINLQGILSVNEVEKELKRISHDFSDLINLPADLINKLLADKEVDQPQSLIALERFLWPMKIDQPNIPTFMLPIRVDWAVDLFDSALGRQTLLGSDPDLIFKMDNVYYRSSKQKLPTAPSRILWYVSRGKKRQIYQGDMSVRACSYVDEIIVGTPKELYKRFSKMGVYNWQHVYETAKKDVNNEILAFRFSHTELFDNPIPLEMLKEILNRKSAPPAPIRLTIEQFSKLYKIGTGKE